MIDNRDQVHYIREERLANDKYSSDNSSLRTPFGNNDRPTTVHVNASEDNNMDIRRNIDIRDKDSIRKAEEQKPSLVASKEKTSTATGKDPRIEVGGLCYNLTELSVVHKLYGRVTGRVCSTRRS